MMLSLSFETMSMQMLIALLHSIIYGYWLGSDACQTLENLQYPLSRIHGLETVVDLRGDGTYKYRGRNHLITSLEMNHTMEIQFELKLQFVNHETRFLQKIPILFFHGDTVKMTIYLNEKGQFGIMHFNRNLDQSGYWKRLLSTNLFFIPEKAADPIIGNPDGYQHFTIQLINRETIIVGINGYVIRRQIDRDICPVGESMNVWLDREGFKVKGAIHDLVIRAR